LGTVSLYFILLGPERCWAALEKENMSTTDKFFLEKTEARGKECTTKQTAGIQEFNSRDRKKS
jgi:hypothetical protein